MRTAIPSSGGGGGGGQTAGDDNSKGTEAALANCQPPSKHLTLVTTLGSPISLMRKQRLRESACVQRASSQDGNVDSVAQSLCS